MSGATNTDGSPPPSPTATKAPGRQSQGVQLLPLLVKYFKLAGLLLLVWIVGYFGFSSTWVLIAIFFYAINEEYRKSKEAKKAFAKEAVLGEKKAILARVEELPSWVYFPDVERAEWLNKMLIQMWPYIGEYVKTYIKTSLEPMVNNSLPASLKPFKFEQIDLGDIPPRIGGVKVYIEHCKRNEIIMDMELFYASDSNICVAVRGMNAGIKDLTIHGTVRIVMKPLVNTMPIIGGMNVFFLNQPAVDFDLTNAANFLDIPLLSSSLRTVVEDYISYFMVLPNKIPIVLSNNVTSASLRYVMPQGVLRIHCVAGRDLKKADVNLFGKGKSDPYLKLYVGAQTYKTKVRDDTVNPVWNEYFEAAVDQKFGQVVEIECLDKDPGDDDELGTASIDIEQIAVTGTMDSWLPLENVSTGMVHIRALWLHLSKDPADLTKAKQSITSLESSSSEHHLSSCILSVTLDSAKALPRQKKSMGEPSSYVKLTLGNETKKSMVKPKTTDPTWEENYQFFVHDPNQQDISFEVLDSNRNDKKLGSLQVPLKSLLAATDLTLNQPFALRESGQQSKITVRLCLRILTSEIPADWAQDVMEHCLPEPAPEDLPDHISCDTPAKPDPKPNTKPNPKPATKPATTESPKPPAVSSESPKPDTNSGDKNANMVPEVAEETIVMSELPQSKSGPPAETLRFRGASTGSRDGKYGSLQLTIRYSSQRQKLVLVVHKGEKLIPCDDDQLADPYVRIYLQQGKNKVKSSKRKTQSIKNDLNPIYDETFEWSLTPSDLSDCRLDIKVKNHQGYFSRGREHMGDLDLNISALDLSHAFTDWYDLEEPQTDD